jgi:hypothetical protein
VLYPLETIKVTCQAEGLGVAAAVQKLLAGGPWQGVRQLYSGVGAAGVCSIIVGAVHYASFCMSKRAAMAAADGGGSGGSGSSSGGGAGHGAGEASGQGPATAFAAVVGALCTALVESPCDLYRHMTQVCERVYGGRSRVLHAALTASLGWCAPTGEGGAAVPQPCRCHSLTHTHTHTHTDTHTHTNTHLYTHTHTHTPHKHCSSHAYTHTHTRMSTPTYPSRPA